MNADVQGALRQINKSWRAFTHRGKPMTKEQVTKVLVYANNKGYKSTAERLADRRCGGNRSRKLSVSTKFELKKQNLILTENPAILPICCYR